MESTFPFAKCIGQGSVEAPRLWLKTAQTNARECGATLEEKRKGSHIHNEDKDNHQVCSFMWADKHWILAHKKDNAEQITKELVEEVDRWDLEQNARQLAVDEDLCKGGQAGHRVRKGERETHTSFRGRVQDLGSPVQSRWENADLPGGKDAERQQGVVG